MDFSKIIKKFFLGEQGSERFVYIAPNGRFQNNSAKIEFKMVIIFTKINDDVSDFEAVGIVPSYFGRIVGSLYLSTYQFDEFLDFFEPALINAIVNL